VRERAPGRRTGATRIAGSEQVLVVDVIRDVVLWVLDEQRADDRQARAAGDPPGAVKVRLEGGVEAGIRAKRRERVIVGEGLDGVA
jgi:hypothetical protein